MGFDIFYCGELSMKKRIVLMLLVITVALLVVLYCLDNYSPLSKISFKEVIFEDVEELAFLDSYSIEEMRPQYVDLGDVEKYYCKLIEHGQNEYLVTGYRFHSAKEALRFFQQDIKQERFNEEFDPARIPFTWHSSYDKGIALFGMIAQTDVLRIESNTANLEELTQFQNWMASFLTRELTDSV